MSATVGALLMLGVRVKRGDLYHKEFVSIHTDCETVGPGPFCSSCGKHVLENKEESTPLPGYDEDEKFGDFAVQDVQFGRESATVIATVVVEKFEYNTTDPLTKVYALNPANIEASREKLQAALEPLGLWHENDFGIWLGLYYS
jgi:hypothetical protein